MKVAKPVRWKEGMFLRPQHFQQYDRYLEARESTRFQSVESLHWGLIHLDVDEAALDNQRFNVRHLRAVLPDGTLIDSESNARIASREFGAKMREIGQSLEIQVGVRVGDERGPLVIEEGGSAADARFATTEETVYDLDAGRDPVPIEMLTYNLHVFLGEAQTDGYTTLPLARLQLTGDTAKPVRLDPTFSAPALVLSASPVLHDCARAVVEALALTLRDLGQHRGSKDPDPLIQYYALSGSLPVLRDLVQEGLVHPRRVYHELARLAGSLLYRDKQGRSPDDIPAYNHHEPAPVFERLRTLILDLAEVVRALDYRRCPMERRDDLFHCVLPVESKRPGTGFFLELETDEPMSGLRTRLAMARISCPSRIQMLRDNALTGVALEPQAGAPPQLPPGQTGSYFRLKHEDNEWGSQILPAGELSAFVLGAPADLKMNLVVIPPAT